MYNGIQSDAEGIIGEVLLRDDFKERQLADLSWLETVLDDISRFLNMLMREISKLFQKFVDWFARTFGLTGGGNKGQGAETAIKIIVIVLICIVAIAIVAVVSMLIVRTVKRSRGFKVKTDGSFGEELETYSNDADTPYLLAAELREKGDYRGSFRYLFISLLAAMSVSGIIEIHRSKTNRRYLRELEKNSEAAFAACNGFFGWFDLYWYGHRELTADILDSWFERYHSAKAVMADGAKERSEVADNV